MLVRKIMVLGFAVAHILMAAFLSIVFANPFSVFQKIYVREKGTPETIEDTFSVLNPVPIGHCAWSTAA